MLCCLKFFCNSLSRYKLIFICISLVAPISTHVFLMFTCLITIASVCRRAVNSHKIKVYSLSSHYSLKYSVTSYCRDCTWQRQTFLNVAELSECHSTLILYHLIKVIHGQKNEAVLSTALNEFLQVWRDTPVRQEKDHISVQCFLSSLSFYLFYI